MLKRKLNSSMKHECVGGSSSGGGSSNGKRTYALKITVDMKNQKAYIDKSPVSVYDDFAEMIHQKYYIKYAEGELRCKTGEITISAPAFYTGPCTAGLSVLKLAFIGGFDISAYELKFSNNEFTLITRPSENDKDVLFQFNSWDTEKKVAQYNNENLGDVYFIYDLSFVWESVE